MDDPGLLNPYDAPNTENKRRPFFIPFIWN